MSEGVANLPNESGRTAEGSSILNVLGVIRGRARWVLVGSRVATVAALALGIGLLLGAVDYFLRLPEWLRLLHWCVGLGAIGLAWRRYIGPASSFKPALVDVALRVERALPEVRGVLASAADFAQRGDGSRGGTRSGVIAEQLADKVIGDAARAWRRREAGAVVRGTALSRRGSWLGAVATAILLVFAVTPQLASIGAARLLAPWSGASWPKRTGVIDLTEGSVWARGAALPLRAGVTRSNRGWDQTYVAVEYRLVNDGEVGESRRELLTWQQRRVEAVAGAEDAESAEVFERLIEPSAQGVEFRFQTDDDATEWRRVELVAPPAVVQATARITPPAYAALLSGVEGSGPAPAEVVEVDLGPGTDDRAVAPQSLAGSRVELTITLNKPVGVPESVLGMFQDTEDPATRPDFGEVRAEGATWRVAWTLDRSLRLPISLIDEHGIASADEAVYRFEALEDRPAAATITEPTTDRTVLATAKAPITGEGRDDVGLAWVALEHRAFTRAGGAAGGERSGPGGAMEPMGEPVVTARVESEGAALSRTSLELDLATLGLKPGDEVKLTALAMDVLSASSPEPAATRSTVRTLRIISQEQLIEELQRDLRELREAAIRTDQQQGELRERVEAGRADTQARRGQAQVGERLNRQSEQVRRLSDRLRENQLEDRDIQDLLVRAADSLRDAGEASARAGEALGRAPKSQPSGAREGAARGGEKPPESRAGERPQAQGQREEEPSQKDPTGEGNEPAQAGEAPTKPSSEQSGAPQQSGGSEQSESEQGDAQQSQGEQSQGRQSQGQRSQQSGGQPSGQQGDEQQPSPPGGGEPSSPEQPQSRPQARPEAQPEAQQDGAEPAPQLSPEEREAADAQQQVQDELQQLIELLDRGEDNWVVRNTIERLAREQRELREQTRRAGQQTQGRAVSELSEEQRSELDRIEQKQNELAERSEKLAEDIRRREEDLRKNDPAAASAMSQAARRAEQSQLSQAQQQAAQQAGQNQTSQAQRQQQRAEQILEEMLKDLDEVSKAREEVLRRMLASVVESLEALIAEQEAQIAALEEAVKNKAGLAGLDRGMIALNTNTLGALDLVRGGGAELQPIAQLVSRASDAQSSAITELRRPILGATMVREFEGRSLSLLTQALEKARELEERAEDREQKQKMAELRRAYREILERHGAILEETRRLADARELSRRDRQLLRGLGERQSAIRSDLAEVLEQTEEVREARVFKHQHARMDASAGRAVGALEAEEPRAALPAQESLAMSLRNLLEALADPKPDPKRFSEGAQQQQGGGGQGGAQGGLINALKELRLLRSMQQEISARTNELANAAEAPGRSDLADLSEEQRSLMKIGEELLDRMEQKQGDQMEEALEEAIGPGRPPGEPPADPGQPQDPAPDEKPEENNDE